MARVWFERERSEFGHDGILGFWILGICLNLKGSKKLKGFRRANILLCLLDFDFRVPSNYRRPVGRNEFRMVFDFLWLAQIVACVRDQWAQLGCHTKWTSNLLGQIHNTIGCVLYLDLYNTKYFFF